MYTENSAGPLGDTIVSPQATTEPSLLQPKRKNSVTTILVIIVFILVVLVFFLLFQVIQQRQLPSQFSSDLGSVPSEVTQELNQPTETVSDSGSTTKQYENQTHGFTFSHPAQWVVADAEGSPDEMVNFANLPAGHFAQLAVWRVTGFGYCYQYDDPELITVAGQDATVGRGIGGTEMCEVPESYINRGNTYVLIPLGSEGSDIDGEGLPPLQVHLSYEYPLEDKQMVEDILQEILASFEFS